jgi:hypothetical protein
MTSGENNNNRVAGTFPSGPGNWHGSCSVCNGMSPLPGDLRTGRTAVLLLALLLGAIALEIWGIRASLSGFLR